MVEGAVSSNDDDDAMTFLGGGISISKGNMVLYYILYIDIFCDWFALFVVVVVVVLLFYYPPVRGTSF